MMPAWSRARTRGTTVDEPAAVETWDYRGFTPGGHCGHTADLLEHERAVLLNTPGLVPFWESDWEHEPAFQRFWFRCPPTPGRESPHGTYLGSRRWYSRDFWYPDDNGVFDMDAQEWHVIWGPEHADRRVLGPVARCGGRGPSTGEVDGEWACSLWRQHPGNCKFHFVETLDLDEGECVEPDANEAARWEVEWATMEDERGQTILDDYLSGDASQWELADGYYLTPEEVRELIARRQDVANGDHGVQPDPGQQPEVGMKAKVVAMSMRVPRLKPVEA